MSEYQSIFVSFFIQFVSYYSTLSQSIHVSLTIQFLLDQVVTLKSLISVHGHNEFKEIPQNVMSVLSSVQRHNICFVRLVNENNVLTKCVTLYLGGLRLLQQGRQGLGFVALRPGTGYS